MRWIRPRVKRPRGGLGMEIGGVLSAASQMALMYPPGCDEWIRRELAGGVGERGARARSGGPRPR